MSLPGLIGLSGVRGLGRRGSASAPPFVPNDFLQALLDAGADYDATEQAAIQTATAALATLAAGRAWGFHPAAGADLTTARRWVHRTAADVTTARLFNNNGPYVDADWDRSSGLLGNGTTKYLSTAENGDTLYGVDIYSQGCRIECWDAADTAGTIASFGWAAGGTIANRPGSLTTGIGNDIARPWTTDPIAAGPTTARRRGIGRSGAGAADGYRIDDGATVASAQVQSTASPTTMPLAIGARYTNFSWHTARWQGGAVIAGAVDTTTAAALDAILAAYQTALGR